MAEPVYDAAKKDWRARESKKQRPAIDYSPALRDGAGNLVSSLPHITNEADWPNGQLFFGRGRRA